MGNQAICEQYAMVNGSLERCHFPFQVGNRKYTECAPKNGKFFCQTGRRPNEWGYCLPSSDEYLEKYDKFNLIITNNGNSDQGLIFAVLKCN